VTVIPDNKALHALMEGLVVLDKEGKPGPGVAKSWESDPEYRTWTFHLRQDAKWHNGDPVTAQDFVYAIRRLLTPGLAAGYASIVYPFLVDGRALYDAGGLNATIDFKGVEAIDQHTLVYRMAEPTPNFPTIVYFASWLPLNQKAVEAGGDGWANSPATYVGNGAFRLSEYRAGDRIIARKADTYWDRDNIFWDSIQLFMITDASTENNAFLAGELDITQTVQLAEINFWRDRPEYNSPPGLASYYVLFNTTKPPFDDARVRRAFSMVIDRDLIVNRVTRRGERASRGLIPATMPTSKGSTWADQMEPLLGAPRIQEAQALLAEAGYGPGGRPLPPIEYSYNTSDEHKTIGEQLQAMWRTTLGADVRLQNMENGVLLARFAEGDFQFARSSWVADYPDAINFLEIYQTNNGYNRSRMRNSAFDELIQKARVEVDAEKRDAMLADAERKVVLEEAAVAPIYDFSFTILMRTDLEGIGISNMAWINYVRGRRKGN
jgi:ABC-type oligopeptide transport system substrate-binding subunit